MEFIDVRLIILISLTLVIIHHYISTYLRERAFRRFAQANRAELPPKSPPTWFPFGLGVIWRMIQAEKKGQDLFDDFLHPSFQRVNGGCQTYETIGFGGTPVLMTMSPRNIQAILSTKHRDWIVSERRYAQWGALLGRNIFTSDGALWSHQRGMLRPQFAKQKINDLKSTEVACNQFLAVLGPPDDQGWVDVTNMVPLFERFTLDTTTAFLFGESVESQVAFAMKEGRNDLDNRFNANAATAVVVGLDSGEDGMGFAEAFHTVQVWLGMRIRLQQFYWMYDGSRYRRAIAKLHRFADHYVRQALHKQADRYAAAKSPGSEPNDNEKSNDYRRIGLLERLTQETQDPNVLRDYALNMALAGRDTTAALLSWLFLHLAQHKEVWLKLRATVLDTFGPAGRSINLTDGAGLQSLDVAKLTSCRYLQYVLNETLRVSPVTPIYNRMSARDTVLPTGGGRDGTMPMAVRGGQICNIVAYSVHHSKEIWGEDADVFRPERWEGRKNDWDFLPFSGGPRVCLGQQYALVEAAYFTVRLLQQFDRIEWTGPPGRPRKELSLVISPRDGVNVRLRKAKDDAVVQ